MSEDVLKIVIPAVIILVFLAVAGFHLMRYLRGSIKIRLTNTAFNPGEPITGSVELVTRKEIAGNRLYAALIGREVTRSRRDGKTQTHRREVYRDEATLEQDRTYLAGQALTYDFQIPVPTSENPDTLESGLGKTLKTGVNLFTNRRTSMEWMVESRLEAQGLDLVSRRRVHLRHLKHF